MRDVVRQTFAVYSCLTIDQEEGAPCLKCEDLVVWKRGRMSKISRRKRDLLDNISRLLQNTFA